MWIYSKYGIFSIVTVRGDGNKMQVRTRTRHYLEDLLEAAEMGDLDILDTPERDYRHRVVLSTAEWARLADHLTRTGIDYPDFKSHLAAAGFFHDPDNDAAYHGAYGSYLSRSESIYADQH